jgi:phosphoserine phosphatase
MSVDMRELTSQASRSWMDSEKRLNATQRFMFNEQQVKDILTEYVEFHSGKSVESIRGEYREARHQGYSSSPASCNFTVTIG